MKTSFIKKLLIPSIFILFLASCQTAPIQKEYLIEPSLNDIPTATIPSNNILAISEVTGHARINNLGMEYTRSANSIEFFTRSRWGSPPSRMVQMLLVQAFAKTNAFKDVIAQPSDIPAQLRLDTSIQLMRQSFVENQSHVEVIMNVRLLDHQSRRIYFSKTYHKKETVQELNAPSGVKAYNQLWHNLLSEITRDVLNR